MNFRIRMMFLLMVLSAALNCAAYSGSDGEQNLSRSDSDLRRGIGIANGCNKVNEAQENAERYACGSHQAIRVSDWKIHIHCHVGGDEVPYTEAEALFRCY